jgi:hypothetical protein
MVMCGLAEVDEMSDGRRERLRLTRLTTIVAMGVLAVSSCGRSDPGPTGSPPPSADAAIELPVGIEALLDPASRDLLTVLDPRESIEAAINTGDPKGVAAAARASGLAIEDVSIETAIVDGPLGPVLAFAASVKATSITLFEDGRADRWIPADRPNIAIPAPGLPYLTRPAVGDTSRLDMPDDRRIAMVRSLENAIETIDGRPYARLAINGSCDPQASGIVCTLYSTGSGVGAGRGADELSMSGDQRTGWRGSIVDGTTFLGSVPRPFVRSAEWIARNDAAAGRAIADYAGCCGASWDPRHRGRIALTYNRHCAASVTPLDRELAATGDCFDSLQVTVDVGAGAVVSITRHAGP